MRERFPALWLGVNFLAVTGKDAFPVLGQLQQDGCAVDGFMVATGINVDGDFYNIAAAKLGRLINLSRQHGAQSWHTHQARAMTAGI